jgi:hypothetical protein
MLMSQLESQLIFFGDATTQAGGIPIRDYGSVFRQLATYFPTEGQGASLGIVALIGFRRRHSHWVLSHGCVLAVSVSQR